MWSGILERLGWVKDCRQRYFILHKVVYVLTTTFLFRSRQYFVQYLINRNTIKNIQNQGITHNFVIWSRETIYIDCISAYLTYRDENGTTVYGSRKSTFRVYIILNLWYVWLLVMHE